jgi:hypothetical protein
MVGAYRIPVGAPDDEDDDGQRAPETGPDEDGE